PYSYHPHISSFPTRRSSDLVAPAQHRSRKRIVVVPVAVAHVAAVHDHRMIEHRAVSVRRVREPLDEAGEKLRVILLNDGETVELDRKSTRLNSSHVKSSYAV